jgi:Mg-chelatase subunit ChlD
MQGGTILQSFDERMERATPAAKAEAMNLLARVRPEGQTAADPIIETALRLQDRAGKAPEVIYFLTDGFDLMDGAGDGFVRRVETLRKKIAPTTVVHTIGINPAPQDRRILSQLAEVCGGRYIEVN